MSLVTAVTEKATDNRDYNYSFQQINKDDRNDHNSASNNSIEILNP